MFRMGFWRNLFIIILAPLSAAALWLLIAAGASTVLFLWTGEGVTRTEFVFLFLHFIDLYAWYVLLWLPFAWFLMCMGSMSKWWLQRRGMRWADHLFPDWPLLCVGGLLCLPVAMASVSLPVEGDGIVPLLTATGVILCFTTAVIYCGLQNAPAQAKKVTG